MASFTSSSFASTTTFAQGENTKSKKSQHEKAHPCRATQTRPRFERLLPGEPCALDIEFQNFKHVEDEKFSHRIGRIAIVNTASKVALDTYCVYDNKKDVKKLYPREEFQTVPADFMFDNGAVHAKDVEKWAKEMLKDRVVAVHGGSHDKTAFFLEQDVFATSAIVDTQDLYRGYNGYRKGKLSMLASSVLGRSIQMTSHSAPEDAAATMALYLLKRPFDRDAAAKAFEDSVKLPVKVTVPEPPMSIQERNRAVPGYAPVQPQQKSTRRRGKKNRKSGKAASDGSSSSS